MSQAKRFNIFVLLSTIIILTIVVGTVFYVDPAIHYREPQEGKYMLLRGNWQNDGIAKYYDYNAIIIGTSMTQLFKPSEMNKLFDVQGIKLPYTGSYFKTTSDQIERAYGYGKEIKMVVRSLDNTSLSQEKDYEADGFYPQFFYDSSIVNDMPYLLNKEPFLDALSLLLTTSNKNTDMDMYLNWSSESTYGAEQVWKTMKKIERSNEVRQFTESDKERLRANLEQNIIRQAIEHSETEFYLFFPPYSIAYWYSLKEKGSLHYERMLDEATMEMLLSYQNIHLFFFPANTEWTCDLNNYSDYVHYGEWINSAILECMKAGEYELYEDNYMEILDEIETFYVNYDYGKLGR